MKKLFGVAFVAACAFLMSSAYADTVSNAPFKDLVVKQLEDLKQLKVGGYRLAWGAPDTVIEKYIAGATRPSTTTDIAGAVKNAQASRSSNSFAGYGQACVVTLVISNNGAYTSNRTCTTEYPTRAYMDTVLYPQLGIYLVGRLPNIDFAQDNAGYGYSSFYTPAGYVSEFIVFINSTQ